MRQISRVFMFAIILTIVGCKNLTHQNSLSDCAIWYGKSQSFISGDIPKIGDLIYIEQVLDNKNTQGQMIVWSNNEKTTDNKKYITTNGFLFKNIDTSTTGYYIFQKIPGAGVAFFKCE